MGLFGPRSVICPAGQWTCIMSTMFVGLPASWEVSFASAEGKPVDGECITKRTSWIFPGQPEQGRIQQNMVLRRYWINTFYRVSIRPASELVAQIRRLS